MVSGRTPRPPGGSGSPRGEGVPAGEGTAAAIRPGPAPTRLLLAAPAWRAILRHGEETYPEECCGVLLGPAAAAAGAGAAGPPGAKICREAVPLTNERVDSARNRFRVSGAELERVTREAAGRGLDVLGFYHSHPDHPARPSAYDLEHATWPWYSFLIVSVENGRAGEMTSWTLSEDRAAYLPEPIDPPLEG